MVDEKVIRVDVLLHQTADLYSEEKGGIRQCQIETRRYFIRHERNPQKNEKLRNKSGIRSLALRKAGRSWYLSSMRLMGCVSFEGSPYKASSSDEVDAGPSVMMTIREMQDDYGREALV